MKNGLTALLVLCGLNLLAQNTKKISKDINITTRAEYYVLKSDKITKNGTYKEFSIPNDKLTKSGFYENNKKDSIWTDYAYNGIKSAEGNFKDDKRTGVWTYYDIKGTVYSKYDFDAGNFTYTRETKADSVRFKAKKYKVIVGADTVLTQLDQPVRFLGGDERFGRILATNIRIPGEARYNGVNGKTIISFTIDAAGHPVNFAIKQKLGMGCDEEAIRVLSGIGDEWLPGILNGKAVPVVMEAPVSFRTASVSVLR